MYRFPRAARLLNAVGFSRLIARDNARLYASSGAIIAVTTERDTRHDFVTGGRIMERVGLTAARHGLHVHPVTGVLFLMHRIAAGDTSELSDVSVGLLSRAHERIRSTFGMQHGTIVMLFRVGKAGEPSARSSRLPPRILS